MSRARDATPSHRVFADYAAARRFMRPKLATFIKIATRRPVPKALAQGTLDNLWFELYTVTLYELEKDSAPMIDLLEAGVLGFVIESLAGMRQSPGMFRRSGSEEHLRETVGSQLESGRISAEEHSSHCYFSPTPGPIVCTVGRCRRKHLQDSLDARACYL